MTKLLLWFVVTLGFGYTSYFAVPMLALAAWHLLAQGQIPDVNLKDMLNLGGFAVFAFAMYRLHLTTIQQFRSDMAAERVLREGLTRAISDNTAATNRQTEHLRIQSAKDN